MAINIYNNDVGHPTGKDRPLYGLLRSFKLHPISRNGPYERPYTAINGGYIILMTQFIRIMTSFDIS